MLGKANFQIFLDVERVRETVENGPLCFAFDHVQRVRRWFVAQFRRQFAAIVNLARYVDGEYFLETVREHVFRIRWRGSLRGERARHRCWNFFSSRRAARLSLDGTSIKFSLRIKNRIETLGEKIYNDLLRGYDTYCVSVFISFSF